MIKKLSKDEFPGILPIKRVKESSLRVNLMQLAVGEHLELPNEDWKKKNPPAYVIYWLKKKNKMQFEYGKKIDGSGWLFRRIK